MHAPKKFASTYSALWSMPTFLIATISLALVLRLILVICVTPAVAANTVDHNEFGWEMGWTARSIALGRGFGSPFLPFTGPTALVPPVYPYVIASAFRLFGLYSRSAAFAVLAFNSLCSALICLPLFFLVRTSLNGRIARLTALAWAVYPFAIYFSAARVWDYALTGLLFCCAMLLAQRLHLRRAYAWALYGALSAVSVLCNPSIAVLLPLMGIAATYRVWRVGGRWKMKSLLATLAFIAVCLPWTMRNQRVMHSSFFIRDGFWVEFYAGNNGDTRESNSSWAHPASNTGEMEKYQRLGEIAYIAEKHTLAHDFVGHHPLFFLGSCFRRAVRFWFGYWSLRSEYLRTEYLDLPNIPFCICLFWALVRGLRRFWQANPFAALPYLLAVIVFPIPYYLTHSSMDYRQPIEPIIIVLVTIGLFGTREADAAEADQMVELTAEAA